MIKIIRIMALVAMLCVMCFLPQSANAEWENPKEVFGEGWGCASMSVGNPTYNDCKRCDAKGGTFYWRKGSRDIAYCAEPDTGKSPQAAPAAPSATDDDAAAGAELEKLNQELEEAQRQLKEQMEEFDREMNRPRYGAVATGIWEGRNQSKVSAGSCLNQDTADEAANCAVKVCQENGITCQSQGTFTGCGYAATGKGKDGDGRVGWGTGPTEAKALSNCRSQGVRCSKTVGGCNFNANKD